MPTAPQFEWPQGEPLFEVQWRAVTESLAGNGVLDTGDLALSAGTANREVNYAAGTVYYVATQHNETAGSVVLSVGDATNDRWDTIAYDTNTEAVVVHEGTPAANPDAPDITGDEILLGVVYIPQNFDDVLSSSQILNWQGRVSNEASEVLYTDGTGVYGVNNVSAALDELQEAAQITAYPLDIAVDTEASAYPLANSDLANSTVTVNVGAGLQTTNAAIGLGGSATVSVPAGGIGLTELSNPFALPSITDLDLDGNDLVDGAVTAWDASLFGGDGAVPRGSLDDRRAVTTQTASTSNLLYTTADEEIILVDTETNGLDFEVELATADAVAGNTIRVVDVGGGAQDNNITVSTEGAETINGASTDLISENYGALTLTWGGSEWSVTGSVTAGAGVAPEEDFSGAETGNVPAGEQGVLIVSSLEPGETVEVYRAMLTTDTVEAVATGVDLKLVTFDNSGGFSTVSTLITGDGATVYDDETGAPLASYENTGTAAESIGVLVDNTLTTSVDIVADVGGATGR